MDAKAKFYALAVSAAIIMAAGAMPVDDAKAQQADDVMVQGDVAPVESDEAAAPADDVAAPADDVAVQEEAVQQPVPKQKPAAVKRAAKSNLDQAAVRAAPVTRSPRPTRTSTRAIVVPKILGSYR